MGRKEKEDKSFSHKYECKCGFKRTVYTDMKPGSQGKCPTCKRKLIGDDEAETKKGEIHEHTNK